MNIEYFAGLLEGEGSFGVSGPAARGKGLIIRCSMCDEDIVLRLLELGGRVRKNKRLTSSGKTVWTWTVQGEQAYILMGRLLPYMGARRANRIKEIRSMREEFEKTMSAQSRYGYTSKGK